MTPEQQQEWKAKRERPTAEVLKDLRSDTPAAWPAAAVVGKWVWVRFDSKPDPETIAGLKALGFTWSSRRASWQHPCGAWAGGAKGDPRERYGIIPAAAFPEQ